MRRSWHLVAMLVISSSLSGCGESGESTATPANLDAARDAAKKLQLREAAAKNKAATVGGESAKGK
jgi:predicted small lipoprotein YifL